MFLLWILKFILFSNFATQAHIIITKKKIHKHIKTLFKKGEFLFKVFLIIGKKKTHFPSFPKLTKFWALFIVLLTMKTIQYLMVQILLSIFWLVLFSYDDACYYFWGREPGLLPRFPKATEKCWYKASPPRRSIMTEPPGTMIECYAFQLPALLMSFGNLKLKALELWTFVTSLVCHEWLSGLLRQLSLDL